jgi:large subunit ribosomal protein L12
MEEIEMEYIYAAMLLHKAGKKVEEGAVKKVLEAAGVHADDSRVKALVAALEGVNIDEAVKTAAFSAPVAAAPAAHHAGGEAKKEEKKHEEEKPSAEEAAAGLGALFG